MPALGLSKLGEELPIQGGEALTLTVDQHVAADPARRARALQETVALQQLGRNGGIPRKGICILREQLKAHGAIRQQDVARCVAPRRVVTHP